jgi:hypothetical protein
MTRHVQINKGIRVDAYALVRDFRYAENCLCLGRIESCVEVMDGFG